MSLINDALKKAQRQREAEAAPKVDAPAPGQGTHVARIIRRRRPIPARTLMLLVTGGVLLAVTAAAIAVVLVNLDTIPPSPPKPAPPRRPSAPAATAPITVALPPAKTAADEAPTLPKASTPASAAIAAKPAAPIVAAASILVPYGTSAPPPPPAVVLPVVNPAANAFLDAANVSGVREDGADSKVILNGRIVRIGDIVDPATGLRLAKVDASGLVFTDANGLRYEKSLR